MVELRKRFLEDTIMAQDYKVIVVVVKLPSGALETITNYHDIQNKIDYYIKSYDQSFCLRNKPDIAIVGYLLV